MDVRQDQVICQLGSYQDVLQATACPLCRLLAAMVAKSPIEHSPHCSLQVCSQLARKVSFSPSGGDCSRAAVKLHNFVVLEIKRSSVDGSSNPLPSPSYIGIAASRGSTGIVHIRQNKIRFQDLKCWLSHCESHSHPSERSPRFRREDIEAERLLRKAESRAILKSLRVIDCSTRRIIGASKDCAYFALSYVWGPTAGLKTDIHDNDILPPQLPLTIEDAITVTLKLGCKYLWIDRYCIRQTDADFHAQIRQMNFIYQNSEVTIIAAAGNDANYGLPGVSSRGRNVRPSAKAGRHYLTSTPASVEPDILQSKWNSRAWTYQEAVFSKRRLIFTDAEVFFDCETMRCRESIRTSLVTPTPAYRDQKWPDFLPFELGNVPFDFSRRVHEYTQRSLTYESDALNAFQGVLREFETRRPFRMHNHWGIPIIGRFSTTFMHVVDSKVRSSIQGFMLGLCWNTDRPTQRRPGFPSWSWSGWRGSLDAKAYQYYGRVEDQNDPRVSIELLDGQIIPWRDFEKAKLANRFGNDLSLWSRFLHITAWSVSLKFVECPTSPTALAVDSAAKTGSDSSLSPGFYITLPVDNLHSQMAPLRLLDASYYLPERREEVQNRKFTGLLINKPAACYWQYAFLVVVEEKDDFAERIGSVCVNESTMSVICNSHHKNDDCCKKLRLDP